MPGSVADLQTHDGIRFDLPPWLFKESGENKEISLTGNDNCAEDVLAGVHQAREDAGLLQTHRFMVEKNLADGRLVEVLPAFNGRSRHVSLNYAHGRLLPSHVGAFIEVLPWACPPDSG